MSRIPTVVPEPTEDHDLEIDLRDPAILDALLEARHARRFPEEHIVEWLRASGGTLAERIMKAAAADLIERKDAPAA